MSSQKHGVFQRNHGIKTENPDRLAEFYGFVFSMKEVGRTEISKTNTNAIYLSDGTINLGLIRNPPVARNGIQVLGFQIPSIREVEERLKQSRGLTYKGEPPLVIQHRPAESPYKTAWLQDPDGNSVDLSEEGWEI